MLSLPVSDNVRIARFVPSNKEQPGTEIEEVKNYFNNNIGQIS
jgi:hypothetical protein